MLSMAVSMPCIDLFQFLVHFPASRASRSSRDDLDGGELRELVIECVEQQQRAQQRQAGADCDQKARDVASLPGWRCSETPTFTTKDSLAAVALRRQSVWPKKIG